jgi:hypothetical protein
MRWEGFDLLLKGSKSLQEKRFLLCFADDFLKKIGLLKQNYLNFQ